jgi:quercetin dioxygenase-like cupin family protein
MAIVERPSSTFTPSVSTLEPESFTSSGLRAFFAYRDLGIADATGGKFGFRVVHAKDGEPQTTGWHYHTCDLQVVYCLNGWEEIALEDGRTVRLVPGTCLNIPPGYIHNEVSYSTDMEVMVFTSPAVIGSVPVDPPTD